MGTSKTAQLWLERVAYDMETAKAMLQTGRYIYAVFMCQQAVEKCLKALLAHQGREIVPIHNLRRLSEQAEIIYDFDEATLRKMDFLSSYYINARYKENLEELSKGLSEVVVRDFIEFAEGLIAWLCQEMK